MARIFIVTAYDSFMDDPRASQAGGYAVKGFIRLDNIKERIQGILFRHSVVRI